MSKKTRNLTASDVLEILAWLEAAGLEIWLDGGWGHDALLGEQTRQHDDLDLVIDMEDCHRLIDALAEHGFEVKEQDSPNAFVLTDSGGRQVDVHAAHFDEAGNASYRMRDGEDWMFPAEGLRGEGLIAGRPARCMTPELQMRCKTGNFEPTPADYQDVRLLNARFGVAIPEMYRHRA